jgi:hypothetical protein
LPCSARIRISLVVALESNSASSSCTPTLGQYWQTSSPENQSSFQLDVLKRFLFSVSHPCQPQNPSTSYIYTQTQILKTKDPWTLEYSPYHIKFKEAWVKPRPALPFWTTCIASSDSRREEELVPFFRQETNTLLGLRMCRLATLYLTGGILLHRGFRIKKSDLPADNVSLLLARW